MFLPTFLAKIMVSPYLLQFSPYFFAVFSLLFCGFSPLYAHGEKFYTSTNEQKRNLQPATLGCMLRSLFPPPPVHIYVHNFRSKNLTSALPVSYICVLKT